MKAVQIPAPEQRGEHISAEMQTNGCGLTWVSALSLFHRGISGSAEVKGVENVLRVCKDTLQSSRSQQI